MKVSNASVETAFKIVQWVVIIGLIFCTVNMFMLTPSGGGPIAQVLGAFGAQVAYGMIYLVEAILLVLSSVKDNPDLRKGTLFATYLTMLFTVTLSVMLNGLSWSLLDNLLIAVFAAMTWLYWKFRTDYLDSID